MRLDIKFKFHKDYTTPHHTMYIFIVCLALYQFLQSAFSFLDES